LEPAYCNKAVVELVAWRRKRKVEEYPASSLGNGGDVNNGLRGNLNG
jgi:hypothetical protein